MLGNYSPFGCYQTDTPISQVPEGVVHQQEEANRKREKDHGRERVRHASRTEDTT